MSFSGSVLLTWILDRGSFGWQRNNWFLVVVQGQSLHHCFCSDLYNTDRQVVRRFFVSLQGMLVMLIDCSLGMQGEASYCGLLTPSQQNLFNFCTSVITPVDRYK